jgi:proline iminopeptidase
MYVTVEGRRLYFDVSGEKHVADGARLRERPTLIAIHGAPGLSDHATFKPSFAALADAMQVVYLDLSGAGRSDGLPPGERYSLRRWGDELVAFCAALGIERPFVLGVSGGGFVAQRYAIDHPDHAGGIVLACTQARLSPERSIAMFERLGGRVAADAARAQLTQAPSPSAREAFERWCKPLYNPTPIPPEVGARMRLRMALARAFHEWPDGIWHTMNLLDELPRISCPTLVMAGELDPITPLADSEDIVARLDPKIVRYEVMAGCGHGCWRDQPERSFALLREFVLGHHAPEA